MNIKYKMDYYQEENVIKVIEHQSPHEGSPYKLVIKTYNTKNISGKSTWDYTQGFIYNHDQLIGSIKRNYMSFPFCFFKQNNQEYLISGSSYMRQTILDCQTGEIYDNVNEDVSNYCWASIEQLDENTVFVQGCYWGGGYNYCFFDFTNFKTGWYELNVDESITSKYYLDDNMSSYTIENNIVTIKHDDFDDYEAKSLIIIKLRRVNDKIEMIDLYLSEKQKKIEEERRIKQEIEDARVAELRKNPFYQALIVKINNLKNDKIRIIDYMVFNTFHININYTCIKKCCLSFSTDIESDVNFYYYDWKQTKNHLNFKYKQDLKCVDEIIDKIKELLQ